MMSARLRTASFFRATHRRRPLPASGISFGHQTNCALAATAVWRRGNAALVHHYQTSSSRFVHATPLIFSKNDDASSPFSRLSKSNSSGSSSHDDTSGGARPKPNNRHTTATTASISQVFDDDDDNDASYYNNYTTDAYDFENEEETSQLQLWHETKESEFQQLDAQTTQLLDSSIKSTNAIISQIQQWNEFISSITTDMNFDFRTKHPYYPPSEFMTSITYDAAEKATRLLMHLTQRQKQQRQEKIPPSLEVQAYKLVMNAWSNVFHWSSGDRCEEILEVYGQKFGGDMNYMPSIDDYKTVMKAHLKSCSSRYNTSTDHDDSGAAASPGEKALEILNLLNNVYTAGDLFLKPDVELYSHTIAVVRNTLLDWQLRRRFHGSDVEFETELSLELLSVLEQMEGTMAEAATAGEHDATIQSFHYIIRAYSDAIAVVSRIHLGDKHSASIERSSEQILETLEQFITSNDDAIILSAGGEDEAADNAIFEEIKRCIEGAYSSQLSSRLSVSDFNTALANATTSEQIFHRMKERSDGIATNKSKLFPAPTPDHVQALIRANIECLSGQYFQPEFNITLENIEELPHLKAQRLLKELEVQQAGRPIDGSLYSDIAWAYTQIPHWPSIHKGDKYNSTTKSARELLEHTMHQYSQGSIIFSSVGTVSKIYNNLFSLYSKKMARNSRNMKGKEAAMKQCLALFDDMEYWYEESDGVIAKPDSHTFGLILKTIFNSGFPSSFDCAKSIVQRMAGLGVQAKQRDYLILMKIANDPTKAEEILNRVKANYDRDQSEKPSTSLYSECISAYAKSRHQNSPSKVMHLFSELDQLYQSTGDPDFRPDTKLYGATIDAISKSKSKGHAAIRQAMKLLDKMENDFDSGLIDVGPNRYAYTSILSSISQTKAPDGHVLAEDLLRRMNNRSRHVNDKEILPDTVAYTALLQALARSRSPDKIDTAKKWFAEMETRYAEGNSDLKPNKITYTALINCWRSSGRPDSGEQAQQVLELVEQRCQEGDHEIKPDAMLYSSVIDAWSRGQSTEKVERAWDLYSRMREQYANGNIDMKPNDIIMSTLIKCCGFAQGEKSKKKGLKVLLQCFSEVTSSKNIGQSPSTFYALLTSLSRLVGDDARRRPVSAAIFEACVKAGQLNGSVLNALSECQPELYVKLPFVVNGRYRNEDIPTEWRKNIRETRQA
eukprot:scaffold33_cov147-Skeletonema_menzelii.AAC.2